MKVLYLGHYKENSGWSRAAIDQILAMDSSGIDIVCRNIKLTNKQSVLPERILELENKDIGDATHCIQCVLPHCIVGSSLFKKNVAYFFGESLSLKRNAWHYYLSLVDEIWVPNNDSNKFLSPLLKNPIKTVPQAMDTGKYEKDYQELEFDMLDGSYKFYFLGDLNDRKNLETTIRCYYQSFTASDPVSLWVKVKQYGKTSEELSQYCKKLCVKIQKEMRIYASGKSYPSIKFITSDFSDDVIYSFHKFCDCFVNLSHGEAWSIPSFDAMCLGNHPICSNEGGPKMYIDPTDKNSGTLIDGTYTICNEQNGAFSHLFTGNEYWFVPNEKEVSEAMRYYFETKNTVNEVDKEKIDNFSYKKIGKLMGEMLNE